MLAIIAMGSNLGDRLSYLQFGLDQLKLLPDVEVLNVSSIYETQAIGGPENQDDYLNAVMAISTSLSPNNLLVVLNEIESGAGRVRDIHHGPRTLDLDIIDIENYSSDDPVLTVPHPRAKERAFVLIPLQEIAPEWRLNGSMNVPDLLSKVKDQQVTLCAELKLLNGAS